MVAYDFDENAVTRGRVVRLARLRPTGAERFIAWRRQLEAARTGRSARCLTPHVTETDWLGHFLIGRTPSEALDLELEGSADD